MVVDSDETGHETTIPADEAFDLVGHGTRVRILQVLATTDRADRPVPFSDIREQLDDIDSSHFNYHLKKLVGHFLKRTENGYDFRRSGRRVSQAILSGRVTSDADSELIEVDQRCHHCGAPIKIMYHEDRIAIYCTGCSGTYLNSNYQEQNDDVPNEYGFLGLHDLPPAGMADRTPSEALTAAHEWSLPDVLSTVTDLCPRCAADIEEWIDVCETHDQSDRCCAVCGYRHQVIYSASCRNCTFDKRLPFGTTLLKNTELQSFLTSNGISVIDEDYVSFSKVLKNFEEDVRRTDPFEAVFTFRVDTDGIALTVGDDLTVTSVARTG